MIFIANGFDFFHIRLVELQRFMFTENMLYKLIFSVIFCSTMISKITDIRFVLNVPSFMVISISYRCKHLCTKVAGVWLFSSMSSLVNLKITSFIEFFIAENLRFSGDVESNRFMTNKLSFNFLNVSTVEHVCIFWIVFNNIIVPIIVIFILEITVWSIQFSLEILIAIHSWKILFLNLIIQNILLFSLIKLVVSFKLSLNLPTNL
jgi:hypothetical protein